MPIPPLPWWFYMLTIGLQIIYSLCSNVLFVSQCAFFSSVSDESMGGTYMTLLNTAANLGSAWPKPLALFAVDFFTCKAKSIQTNVETGELSTVELPSSLLCSTFGEIDGFYVVSIMCAVIGLVWFTFMKEHVHRIGEVAKKEWTCQ
jgi:PAT family acetyl-CoA transporter-like MFS transporter 1